MPVRYKNCHMRLDRFASNSYGEYNGVALDGLPYPSLRNNAVLTTPHTHKNMYNSLQPKFERLNPANEIAVNKTKDHTASSTFTSQEVIGQMSHRSGPATEQMFKNKTLSIFNEGQQSMSKQGSLVTDMP